MLVQATSSDSIFLKKLNDVLQFFKLKRSFAV